MITKVLIYKTKPSPFLAVEKRYGRRGAKPILQKISIKDDYKDINI
jgi:hypothetical protein